MSKNSSSHFHHLPSKLRLDKLMAQRGLAATRSEAESWIRLGRVTVGGKVVQKPGTFVDESAVIALNAPERYVSRAGLKLASVAQALGVDFAGKVVLDVGSSTGGFTDYALQHGARKVIAVDVGTDQLHPSLRNDPRVELHEKTDIRSVWLGRTESRVKSQESRSAQVILNEAPSIVVIDVSFISLRDILPHIASLLPPPTSPLQPPSVIIAMVKPQFEAGRGQLGSSGVVKNNTVRRDILAAFEQWSKRYFVVANKADSQVHGANGNVERFYLLKKSVK